MPWDERFSVPKGKRRERKSVGKKCLQNVGRREETALRGYFAGQGQDWLELVQHARANIDEFTDSSAWPPRLS